VSLPLNYTNIGGALALTHGVSEEKIKLKIEK
jgi:hypothetical protein